MGVVGSCGRSGCVSAGSEIKGLATLNLDASIGEERVGSAPPLYTIVSRGPRGQMAWARLGPGLSLGWMSCKQAKGVATRKHRTDGIKI